MSFGAGKSSASLGAKGELESSKAHCFCSVGGVGFVEDVADVTTHGPGTDSSPACLRYVRAQLTLSVRNGRLPLGRSSLRSSIVRENRSAKASMVARS